MTPYTVTIQHRSTLRPKVCGVVAETREAAVKMVRQKYAGTGWVVMETTR